MSNRIDPTKNFGYIRQEVTVLAGLDVRIFYYEWGWDAQIAWEPGVFEFIDVESRRISSSLQFQYKVCELINFLQDGVLK